MLDPRVARAKVSQLRELLSNGRGNAEKANIDRWLTLDSEKSRLERELQLLNREINSTAKAFKPGDQELRRKGQQLKEQKRILEERISKVAEEWRSILCWFPNIPEGEVYFGRGEEDNIILKLWTPKSGYVKEAEGKKARNFTEKYMPKFPHSWSNETIAPKHHLDIGELLNLIDNIQAGKVSGSRFTYLIGDLVLMQYAIQRLLFDYLIERGFIPIVPPLLVKERALYGSSHFPEGKEQVYAINTANVEDNNQLYLVGSTEPSNFAYFMDRILNEEDLPIRIFAYAPAFRSEAGSWGKDTKGIKRMHQFDKIEMNSVCTPEQSNGIFDEFLGINEWLLQSLELPYQLAYKCTGDSGYLAAAKQVDPEVWLPGQDEFMEVGTDTNTTDFQARELNIRYRDKDGNKKLVHTVNDTGVAMGRMLISIICNYQTVDGGVVVPKVLQKYMNKVKLEKLRFAIS